MAYTGGVFNRNYSGTVNHGVVLVGWDDSTQSWILRNSWDTWWGEGGYMRIAYNCSSIGVCSNYVVYKGGISYLLRAKHSGKVLDVGRASTDNGANVHQWTYWGGDNQKWLLQDAGNGSYYLKAKHSGKYLDVSAVSTATGANVHQWAFTGAANQQWELQDAGNGYYYLKAKHSGKYLDVAGVSTADGANVWQWTFTGAANQQWKLEQVN
jgi:hypothetical protein